MKERCSPKLQSFWDGPFLVVQKLSDLVYEIQKSPTAKPRVVHHDRLKPCYEKLASRLNVRNTNTQDENLVKKANDQPFISDDHPTNKDVLPMPEVEIQPTPVKESGDHQSEKPGVDESSPPSKNIVKDANVPSVTRSGRVTRNKNMSSNIIIHFRHVLFLYIFSLRQCPECTFKTTNVQKFKLHLAIEHGERKWCGYGCHFDFPTSASYLYRRHIENKQHPTYIDGI